VLLRLAYLGVTNAFALLRLLPMSDRDKDVEILALRHQLTVLQRQLGTEKVRFDASDRAFLAALLNPVPRAVLRRVRLLVRPDTVLRWHRNLLARRHAYLPRPRRPGRPATVRSVRVLVLRLARENPNWGYRRLHGELLVLGVKVAASTVWEILKEAGIDPAPERAASTWADFLRSQADALLACDFLETVTLLGARMYVLAVIEHASRRIRILQADRTSDRRVGNAGRQEPRHGPRGHRLPGTVPDPRPGRQIPGAVRRRGRRCGHRRRIERRPDAPHELDHGTVGADLPLRTVGSDLDLEPAASAPRLARVRTVLAR
jgi:transposase